MHGVVYNYIVFSMNVLYIVLNVTFFIAAWWSSKEMESGGIREDRTSKTPRWDCGGRIRDSQAASS